LRIFGEVSIAFNSFSTGYFNHREAVIASIDAAHARQCTRKEAVFTSFGAILHCLRGLSQLALNAERSTECPVAGIAIKTSESTSLDGMPFINAHGNVIGGP
jgi:hypothetical protein